MMFLIYFCFYLRTVNVTVPLRTRKNGTLYIHAFLYPRGSLSPESDYFTHAVSMITTYSLPQTSFINLLGNKNQETKVSVGVFAILTKVFSKQKHKFNVEN